jgi:hypothetical protein
VKVLITTTKLGLKKPESTDPADLRIFVGDNMEILDGHGHAWADITTGKPTEFPPVLMGGGQRGGARVGNGLQMSGEYLLVRTGTGLAINGTTTALEINRTIVDTWYSASGHKHAWADITTGMPTTFPPPLMAIDRIGGAMVGNGLGMTGNYLIVRTGTGIVIDPAMLNVAVDRTVTDTWYAPFTHSHNFADIGELPTTLAGYGITDGASDQDLLDHANYQNGEISRIENTVLDGLKFWSGTQAEYEALTRDANTIYYIIG